MDFEFERYPSYDFPHPENIDPGLKRRLFQEVLINGFLSNLSRNVGNVASVYEDSCIFFIGDISQFWTAYLRCGIPEYYSNIYNGKVGIYFNWTNPRRSPSADDIIRPFGIQAVEDEALKFSAEPFLYFDEFLQQYLKQDCSIWKHLNDVFSQ